MAAFGPRKRRAIELLHRVGIKDHKNAMRSFPYELTEGECQKVMIASALANQPRLLIADLTDQLNGANNPGANLSPADAPQPKQQYHDLAYQP